MSSILVGATKGERLSKDSISPFFFASNYLQDKRKRLIDIRGSMSRPVKT